MSEKLFVYGTLRPGYAPAEIADAVRMLTPVGKGTIRAVRFELGDYPGVKLRPNASGRVEGEVFSLPSDPSVLARLDEYEEFQPENPKKSLFRRRRATVALQDGTFQKCWVYEYNRPVTAEQKVA